MSEQIYLEVEDAIRRRRHVRNGVTMMGGPSWVHPTAIEYGMIVVKDSDCDRHTWRWTPDEWALHVADGGLWRQVGRWDFAPADDPAADDIAWCHRCPEAAGRELYRLRKFEARFNDDNR